MSAAAVHSTPMPSVRTGLLRAGILLVALVLVLAPFAFLMVTSIKPPEELAARPPTFLPIAATLEHWRDVLDPDGQTLRYLLNSLIITTGATALAVATGTMAAFALARIRLPFRLSAVLGFVFLAVRFYPKVSVALPSFVLARSTGLLDTHLLLILVHGSLALPFVVWLVLGFIEELPKELEESAVIDGASPWQRLVLVVLPIAAPAVATAAVLTAILSWNEFLMASALAPNEAKTLPVRIAGFITDKGTLWGPMSAMGTLIVVPVMIFALMMQRWLVRGLTMGAVKE